MEEVRLPPPVEDLLRRICTDKKLPWPDAGVRRELASISQERAHEVLVKVFNKQDIRSLGGFIKHLIRNLPASPPPSTAVRAYYDQSPSACPVTPPRSQLQYSSAVAGQAFSDRTEQPVINGPYGPSPYSSGCKAISSFSYPTIPLACNIAPVQLDHHRFQGEVVTKSPDLEKYGGHGQAHLAALGTLEFRKQFLILSYIREEKLKNVIVAEDIKHLKDLPMAEFESKVWLLFGHKYISNGDRQLNFDWDGRRTHFYECHVTRDGSYTFKGPYLQNERRTLLQKLCQDDNVLIVKFDEEGTQTGSRTSYDNDYSTYMKVERQGIFVGLRRYRFFGFKDGGKRDKIRSPTSSPVKCYFVRVSSDAAIDRDVGYWLSNRTIHEGRRLIMHVDTLPSVDKVMARLPLIFSKTTTLEVDWSLVKVEEIDDVDCFDESGNCVYNEDGKPLLHTDGTGFISEDLALLCPKIEAKRKFMSEGHMEGLPDPDELEIEMKKSDLRTQEPPLLIQCRLFHEGNAYKGTLLVNKWLPPKTLQIRPSMRKVEKDPKISDNETINSLEIVCTSAPPRKAYLSRIIIALLVHGGVPKDFFMKILDNALEDAHRVIGKTRAAVKVAEKYGEIDDNFLGATMIRLGIPLEESYLQYRLSHLMRVQESTGLRKGRLHIPDSYVLMGTADPTGILERDEVCVILKDGQLSGKVLVYRYPGLHFGDIKVLKATYVKELESIVGDARYAIFFSCKGPRNVADEIGGGDFDGDLYWVSRNPQLLEWYKPSEPWNEGSTSTQKVASNRPTELSTEDLEADMFRLFLKNRFQPSFAMSEAANNWLAWMDWFLTLEDSNEKKNVMDKILKLVDIYYIALDAAKKGVKVEVPKDLKVSLFPHYMDKKKEETYISSSILGEIYDEVDKCQAKIIFLKEIKKLPIFDINQVPELCLAKWKKRYGQYRTEMSSAMDEDGDQAATVIRKYKKLYKADDFEHSSRPMDEILDEAHAIYHVCYDHATDKRDVKKCSFAWRVAGKALCELHARKKDEKWLNIAPSVLKELL
ncbi:hypothetical protein ABKV19_001862 [Rosa sericea]